MFTSKYRVNFIQGLTKRILIPFFFSPFYLISKAKRLFNWFHSGITGIFCDSFAYCKLCWTVKNTRKSTRCKDFFMIMNYIDYWYICQYSYKHDEIIFKFDFENISSKFKPYRKIDVEWMQLKHFIYKLQDKYNKRYATRVYNIQFLIYRNVFSKNSPFIKDQGFFFVYSFRIIVKSDRNFIYG